MEEEEKIKKFDFEQNMATKLIWTITISFSLIVNCYIFAIPLSNEQISDNLSSVIPLSEVNVGESSENRTDNETSKNL